MWCALTVQQRSGQYLQEEERETERDTKGNSLVANFIYFVLSQGGGGGGEGTWLAIWL